MKVSKRDVLLLIGFLGILLAVCSYLFVFQPTMEKADKLAQENQQLQLQIADLTVKMANKDSYVSQTDEMKQEMKAVYQLFPVDVREEDAVLLAINQELMGPMAIDSITIEALQDVSFLDDIDTGEDVEHTYEIDEVEEYESEEGVADDAAAPATESEVNYDSTNPYSLKNRRVTMNYAVSYEGLKRSIKNIALQTNRMVIDNVTVAYDDTTGLLRGMTTVNMYCVWGQEDKEYVAPDFSSVLLGTDNIFGTIKIHSEDNMADLEENAEGTAE